MTRTWQAVLSVSLLVGLAPAELPKGTPQDKPFQPGDAIETVEIKIDVGEAGDLDEPVALDLGLGFPLWLHPVGRKAGESAPFGAVPQQTTAQNKIGSGTSTTFTFSLKGEDGQDTFQTTPQLLAGLQVQDVARVGFASRGSGDWTLAGYEIKINGKVLASGKAKGDQVLKAKAAQEAARKKLADLELQITPLQTARAELADLIATGLATAADKDQVAGAGSKLVALVKAKRRLEGQVQGNYPWFEDKEFRAPWRSQPEIKLARVTLVTATHSDAETQNYVYVHTGGRKYLLGSPANPLTAAAGPQVVNLDLEAGPLGKADLRIWALGMLAHPDAQGKAPDRWHPQRFRVEIDGQAAYDSEDNDSDRRSLDAIRLIPPVHRNETGQLVKNIPASRETFVWEAGKGAGLDPGKGTPLPLVGPGQKGSPEPETPPPAPEKPDKEDPEAKVESKTSDSKKDDSAGDDGKTADPKAPTDPDKADLFPGEKPASPDGAGSPDGGKSGDGGKSADGGKSGDGGGSPDSGGGSSGSGGSPADPGSPMGGGAGSGGGDSGGAGGDSGGPGGGPDSGAPPSPGPQSDPTKPPDPTQVPTPSGSSFQVYNVRITGGIWKADQTFKVTWKVSGDEKDIDHYVVSLQPVQPHQDDPFSAAGILLANCPKGSRSAEGPLGPLADGVDSRSLFLRPVVTAIPLETAPPADPATDPKQTVPPGQQAPPQTAPPPTPHVGAGPARAIFPAGSVVVGQPAMQTPFSYWHVPPPPKGIIPQAISWAGPTPGLKRAVWPVNRVVRSDSDILFDSAWPGRHLAVRLQEGDTGRLEMQIPRAAFSGGKRHLVAHLGFLGGPGATNTVKAQLICDWRTSTNAAAPGAQPALRIPVAAGSFLEAAAGDTMKLIDQEFDAAKLPPGAHHLRVRVYVTGGPFDRAHPPALVGVRLVP
jgi:hypothetical protein